MRLLLLLLTFLPLVLHGHGTEMIGGRLEVRDGGEVVLHLDIIPPRLSLFAGSPAADLRTWGEVRGRAGGIDRCFQEALRLRTASGALLAPVSAGVPALAGAFPPGDGMLLPDFVPVVVTWRGVPPGTSTVVTDFRLPTSTIILVLEDGDGQALGLAEDGAAAPVPLAATSARAESWWRTLGRALVLGIAHIVPGGIDHILFVLGLYLAVRRVRDLVWQVTAFTVAHCLTLGLAMGGVVVLGPAWGMAVEIGIALSIVAVTVENCLHHDAPGWRRIALVGIFGLIHGLGFASALAAVHWPAGRFLPALVAANVGIECGQFIVIGGAALLTAWWWDQAWYRWRVVIPSSAAIGLCGLTWAVQRAWQVTG